MGTLPVLRIFGVLAFVLMLVAGGTATAGAHTTIDLAEPVDGSRLQEVPAGLTVRFGESLPLRDTHVRVALASGRTVVEGRLTAQGDPLASATGFIALPAGQGAGSYVVTVTARGTDGHTVAAGFAFTVGKAPLVRAEGATSSTDPAGLVALGTLGAVVTSIGLAGAGFLYVASWCWPGATRLGAARRTAGAGLFLVAAGGVLDWTALVWAQGAMPAEVLGSQAGRLLVLRIIGVMLVGLAMRSWMRADGGGAVDRAARQNLLFLAGVPLVLGVVGSSHAGSDAWALVTLLVGCVHVVAMGLWLGGLAWLWFASSEGSVPVVAASRFSSTALACAVAVLVTGLFLAGRLSQGFDQSVLLSGYGLVLAVKVGLVGLLLLAARRTNRLVRGLGRVVRNPDPELEFGGRTATVAVSPALPKQRLALGRALRGEVCVGASVLVAASLLAALGPGQ